MKVFFCCIVENFREHVCGLCDRSNRVKARSRHAPMMSFRKQVAQGIDRWQEVVTPLHYPVDVFVVLAADKTMKEIVLGAATCRIIGVKTVRDYDSNSVGKHLKMKYRASLLTPKRHRLTGQTVGHQGSRQMPHWPQFSSTPTSIMESEFPNCSLVCSRTRSAMTRAISSAVVFTTGKIIASSFGKIQRRWRNRTVVSVSSSLTKISRWSRGRIT